MKPIDFRAGRLSDLEQLVPIARLVNAHNDYLVVPDFAHRRFVKALLTSPEKGFFTVAEREGEILGCLSCEFQRNQWTGEEVVYLSTFWCAPGVPTKTAHTLLYWALCKAFSLGHHKVLFNTDGGRIKKAYEKLGGTPAAVFYVGDVAEGLERLRKRGV